MKRSASHRPPPWVNRHLPPIDYGDGLAPHLTPTGNTEITKCIQRRLQHTAILIGIDRNG